MRFPADTADDVLIRAGIAALYYDDVESAIAPAAIQDDIEHVLEPVAMAAMTDEEQADLRDLTWRFIVDPSTHRRAFRTLVLDAITAPRPLR